MSAHDKISIWSLGLYRRPMSLKEYQDASREFLAAFQRRFEGFRNLLAVGHEQERRISPDLTGIDDDIAAAVFDEGHPSDYLHLTGSGHLGPYSQSRIGFALTYNVLDASGRAMQPIENGGICLRLRGTSASIEPEASAAMELPMPSVAGLATDEDCRSILSHLIANWPADVGGVSIRGFRQSVRGTASASYAGQWLYYLPFPHLARCLPPDIHHEPFASGILIQTTPHMPDANNPADVAAGKRVAEVLDEFGLINDATYAISGWPPDQQETIYEQFITGAPPNRKYSVHCINFDGYDPERKVLLYAKLFRRLQRHPKEWGLRGWDGPVLNEAKRQVRAAAKAGGVPIEWHVGFEEPALQVRQLLADYTNITEQQLRVIYTPLEEALTRP